MQRSLQFFIINRKLIRTYSQMPLQNSKSFHSPKTELILALSNWLKNLTDHSD